MSSLPFIQFFPHFYLRIRLFFSEPTHNGDPVDLPALNDPNYYLDVTNDGVKIAAANKAAKDLWDQIERQIHQINAAQSKREEL